MFNDHDGLSSEWKKVGQHAQQDIRALICPSAFLRQQTTLPKVQIQLFDKKLSAATVPKVQQTSIPKTFCSILKKTQPPFTVDLGLVERY